VHLQRANLCVPNTGGGGLKKRFAWPLLFYIYKIHILLLARSSLCVIHSCFMPLCSLTTIIVIKETFKNRLLLTFGSSWFWAPHCLSRFPNSPIKRRRAQERNNFSWKCIFTFCASRTYLHTKDTLWCTFVRTQVNEQFRCFIKCFLSDMINCIGINRENCDGLFNL